MKQIDPKFTSLKMNIMKSVKVGAKVPPNLAYAKEAVRLDHSILFHIPDLDNYDLTFKPWMLDHIPFNDIMFLADVVTVNDETGEETKECNGYLFRVVRKSESTVRVFQYMQSNMKDYVLVLVVDVQYKPILVTTYIFKPTIGSVELNNTVLPILFKAIALLVNYTPTIHHSAPISSSFRKKVKPCDVERYIVYTLDKTKPKQYKSVHKGGTHASPVEHERIGHWRTYKSGKKVFVAAVTVNKGKGGRVEKDYQF